MPVHGLVRVAALVLLPALLSGCELLLGARLFEPGIDEPFAEPSVSASYTSGAATIAMTRDGVTETITLASLAGGAQLTEGIGADVTWRNDDGWSMTLFAFDDGGFGMPGSMGNVNLQRINGMSVWTTADYTSVDRCIVDVIQMSEEGLSGQATCRGLRWIEGFGAPMGGFGDPPYIEGEPAFDAEITFEAKPDGSAETGLL